MNHLRGYLHPGLTRYEHDASPAAGAHVLHVMAREAHAAHHVGLKEPQPIRVADIGEWLRLDEAEVADEDIYCGHAGEEHGAALRIAESATTPLTRAAGTSRRSASIAAGTRASLRPLITTSAPSAASARAVAQPMPAVEPVTSARLSSIPRSMSRSPVSMRSINPRHRRAHSHYSVPRQTRRTRKLDYTLKVAIRSVRRNGLPARPRPGQHARPVERGLSLHPQSLPALSQRRIQNAAAPARHDLHERR